jgi:type I restriction enzyme S subunit
MGMPPLFDQRVGAIRPFQRDLVPLINVFLKSDQLLDLVFATATGTANQANIGTASILDLPFPLPPLAEQRRIVAKVDELMALVDAQETQLATARTTATRLLAAAVAELTSNP